MFTVESILDFFLTDTIIESMGNWYPRVIAVMSCVIPTMYIAFTFVSVLYLLYAVWKILSKG